MHFTGATGRPGHLHTATTAEIVSTFVRSTGAHFYKRRPTPKPGLDFCTRDRAEISDGISNKFPLGFRWRAVGQPMERRWSTTVRVPPCHCTARCVPSTYCSRAALHVAPRALRQRQARRASRWGRSLPTGDAGNRRKTCPAQNQEFCATKAKRGKSQPVRATSGLGGLRVFGFLRATLAPVIQQPTRSVEDWARCKLPPQRPQGSRNRR